MTVSLLELEPQTCFSRHTLRRSLYHSYKQSKCSFPRHLWLHSWFQDSCRVVYVQSAHVCIYSDRLLSLRRPDFRKMETWVFFILHVRLIWLPMKAMLFSWRPKLSKKRPMCLFHCRITKNKRVNGKSRELLEIFPELWLRVFEIFESRRSVISHAFGWSDVLCST